jgi:predicted Zn-dependent protease with MMP-like domain
MSVSDEEFQAIIDSSLSQLPAEHLDNIKNVAILYEYEPSPEQRVKLKLRNDQTLLGLYEGIPLSQRQGMVRQLPDKITLFKGPLTRKAADQADLESSIKHTLWHEVAHYYGLNHAQIDQLDQSRKP